MSSSTAFEQAAAYLSNSSSLSNVSSTVKLELYGLFKYITVSPQPNSSRPSFFDIVGRSKWDAWKSVGDKMSSREEAEQRYLEIAQSLGWSENASPVVESEAAGERNGGGLFGPAVSTLAAPEEQDDGSLHFLALNTTNDISRIRQYLLEEQPDVNAKDEFGYTALHLAADRGNINVVELLLKQGADPTIKDGDGLSAAEIAQVAGHEEIAKLLS